MRRRRLAVALAVVLALVAVGVSAVAGVVYLSPRDYRLIRLLGRTQRIEQSFSWDGWVAHEVLGDVAQIVSAAVNGLERTSEPLPADLSRQVRFCLDGGEHVTLIGANNLGEWERLGVRLPGDATPRCFRASEELKIVLGSLRDARFVGTIEVDGERRQVFDSRFRDIDGIVLLPPLSPQLLRGRKRVEWRWTGSEPGKNLLHLSVDGNETIFSEPPIRRHSPPTGE